MMKHKEKNKSRITFIWLAVLLFVLMVGGCGNVSVLDSKTGEDKDDGTGDRM